MLRKSLWLPNQKPIGPVELDWDSPLTSGLVSAILPEPGRIFESLLGGVLTKTGNFVRETLPTGFAPAGGTGASLSSPVVTTSGGAPFSVFFKITPRTLAAQKGIFSLADNPVSDYPTLLIQANNADLLVLFAGNYRINIVGALVVSKTIGVAFTHDGTTGRLYVNGLLVGSYASGLSTGAPNFYYGSGYNGQFAANYHELYQWKRVLDATEVAELYRNPYQILKPRTRRVWVPVITGGSTTHYQNIFSYSTTTAARLTQVAKPLTFTSSSTSSQTKSTTKTIAASSTATTVIDTLKVLLRFMTAGASSTVTFTKSTLKNIQAISTSAVAYIKQVYKTLAPVSISVATLNKVFDKPLSVVSTVTSNLNKSITKSVVSISTATSRTASAS